MYDATIHSSLNGCTPFEILFMRNKQKISIPKQAYIKKRKHIKRW